MDSLKQKVINSLKWKKNTEISAARCNMPEELYIKIKREILDERKKERRTQKKKTKFFHKAAEDSQLV